MKKLLFLIFPIIVLYVYSAWLFSPTKLSGDFVVSAFELHDLYFSHQPYVWSIESHAGFGGYVLYPITYFTHRHVFQVLSVFISDVSLRQTVQFFVPALVLMIGSAVYAAHVLLTHWLARGIFVVLYLVNTYIIMMSAGGQVDLIYAYGLVPLLYVVWDRTISHFHIAKLNWQSVVPLILLSLFLLLMLASFDLRGFVVTLLVLAVPVIHYFIKSTQRIRFLARLLLFSVIFVVLFVLTNLHWILPSVLSEVIALPQGYETEDALRFLSFAQFHHALLWMHPNYPFNLFGYVPPVAGTALLFPILVFWSLRYGGTRIALIASMCIAVVFLAKGSNDPFGWINTFLFLHLPGMSLFRDATKFYAPLSFGYALLIAHSIQNVHVKLTALPLRIGVYGIISLTILNSWWPTFAKEMPGTLAYTAYPAEHQLFGELLERDSGFARVLWIPQREPFGYYDVSHVPVNLFELRRPPMCLPQLCVPEQLPTSSDGFTLDDYDAEMRILLDVLYQEDAEQWLQALGIGYVVVPYDYAQVMFLDNYEFNPQMRSIVVSLLDNVPYLQRNNSFSELTVYQLGTPSALFRSDRGTIAHAMREPTRYELTNIPKSVRTIYFAQRFDPRWRMRVGQFYLSPEEDTYGMMRFTIDDASDSSEQAVVYFVDQQHATLGWSISRWIWVFLPISTVLSFFIFRVKLRH